MTLAVVLLGLAVYFVTGDLLLTCAATGAAGLIQLLGALCARK
jgi:hypothetical protein